MSLHVQPLRGRPLTAGTAKQVEAELGYVIPGPGKPAVAAGGSGERVEQNFAADPRRVRVANGWLAPAATLDREGFALVRHETALADFADADAIERLYYPEMQALLRQETGAAEVVVFDHNLRRDGSNGRNDEGHRPPVRRIHNDFTARSATRRLADLRPGASGPGGAGRSSTSGGRSWSRWKPRLWRSPTRGASPPGTSWRRT